MNENKTMMTETTENKTIEAVMTQLKTATSKAAETAIPAAKTIWGKIKESKIAAMAAAAVKKHPKSLLAGGTASAAAGVLALIARFGIHSEMEGIRNSYAMLVQVGAQQMSKAEYLEYAAGVVSNCTAVAVVFLIAAAVLFAYYYKQNAQ